MIVKSLIIISIACSFLGLPDLASKFDQAVIKEKFGSSNQVVASGDDLLLPNIFPRPQIRPGAVSPAILAKNYLLIDFESGKTLLKQDYRQKVPIASTTKIMTAVVVLENYDLDDVVTVSATANSQLGATANLQVGEEITVHNLLKALLIKSGNDSAYALAEYMNRPGETGQDRFVQAMNAKAKSLQMDDTEYYDPAGLDTTGYSSAYDLFLVTKHALKNPVFAGIVKTDETSIRSVEGNIWHQLKTSNRLIGEYKYLGAIGVKTGYMPEAGHILVSAARRDGHTLVGVIINTFADTATASADESRKILDWGFENIEW